ncbi:MAG TPA: hypothetical protein VKE51_15630, partial [Vicinamibacterales bacterium]|nr:hypothetical protein [Vicinamibacterales bacterium]
GARHEPPLATLTDRFLKERTYLKNVTPATLRWYRIAFKNYEASFPGEAPLPSKTALQVSSSRNATEASAP